MIMKSLVVNKRQLATGILLGIWLVVLVIVFTLTLTGKALAGERKVPVYRVRRTDKKIAVTFDCAWGDDTTEQVLNILDENHIKATFFIVGTYAKAYPESVRKIADAGHEIGNHSYAHGNPLTTDFDALQKDILLCNELIEGISGKAPSLYRAPSGAYNNQTIEAAERMNMTAVQWDVDSIDWKNISSQEIINRITKKTTDGSILLFHLGKENTAQALPQVIEFLLAEGYEPVTVSELLPQGDFTVDANGCAHGIASKG